MSDARAEILTRIRQALAVETTGAPADHAGITRAYGRTGALDAAGVVALLVERLEHYEAGVHRSTRAAVSDTVARVLASRDRHALVIPGKLPHAWRPTTVRLELDDGSSAAALDRSDGVITGCTVAIALTGTIVLRHGPTEGRRALTLVPDYHLCIVGEDQIVETVAEGLERAWGDPGPGLLTTISGPSATADIEMTRIKGVHGPRTLDVVIVGP